MIRITFVTLLYSFRNQFVSELVRPLACLSRLVVILLLLFIYLFYLFFFFFKLSIPYIGSIDKCHTSAFNALIISILSLVLLTRNYSANVSNSRFVWANGRASRIGRTIPVRSIGRVPLLEALPSLPLDIWKSRQSFRNKIPEAANET